MSSDMGVITGSILLLCLIGLTNANTSPTISELVYNVCEDIPEGAYAFTIQAADKENNPLTYSLTGPNAGYFTVERSTGRVSISRQLNRETDRTMELGVVVSDGPNSTPGNLILIIDDANDNPPIFLKSSYDIKIPENTTVGTTLFRANATDEDISYAAVIRYSIAEVTPDDGFNLFSIVSTTAEVKLNGSLNFNELSTYYRLMINATDGGGRCYENTTKYHSTYAFSIVTVVDVPDLDPVFNGIPYEGRVEENSPEGKSVFRVTAVDQDKGVNDDLIYSIENSTADGLFTISPTDGVISVLSTIDREDIGDSVTLTVKATESNENIHGVHASATADVHINIIDINDNEPKFYACDSGECVEASHFTGEVLEHTLGLISINMTVRDPDKLSKTKLTLEGEDKDVFSVEPQSTMSDSIVQLLVKQPQKVDYEKKTQMVLQVIAVDEEKNTFISTATVTINIKDDNDNSPLFENDTYELTVPEHSAVGTILANITAYDPDTMDQGKITYRLLPDSIRRYFDVNPDTGSVYVKDKDLLDWEVRSLHSATLQARDSEGKPGTTVLEITVTDINDKAPVIFRESYTGFVKEGGNLELRIEALDADDPETVNSQIVYEIVDGPYSDNFTIDPDSGVLRNSGELDREAMDPQLNGTIELNVTATDKGSPPLSTWVAVNIDVEDINDNKPQFEHSSYNFTVKEGKKGVFVGSVQAKDLDQTTDFNRISYSIIEGSVGSFIMRTFTEEWGYRGNLTVDPDIELDYESARKQYKLLVEAADLDEKKAEVEVYVHVLDVNDERPEFTAPTFHLTVKENTTIIGAVGNFTAQDKDGNHSLVYELESINCRCSGSLTPCSWFILDPTGNVRVNPEHTVDYEECDQVVMEAQVVDEFTEKGENNSLITGKMEINIEDINDNAPEFIFSDSVFVVVSESASKDTSVAGVTATDRDSGINAQIKFDVTAVHFQDTKNQTRPMKMLFVAINTQQNDRYVGMIQTTEGLDTSLQGKYLVTVKATDTGDLSTSTVLEIFVVDISYKVELAFRPSQEEVERNEKAIINALSYATLAEVKIAAIRPYTAKATRAQTIVEAYFIYSNGTALNSNEVEKMISDPEHTSTLIGLGLADIGKAPEDPDVTDPVQYGLMGMVVGLIVVLAVLTTSLVCTRRNYRRKLKAAKAMNSASMVTSDNQKSGPVVPGTNKYTMQGANPVLNLNIDTTMVLDMDEESSDVDKVSLNSLDCTYDMTLPEKNGPMRMIQEEEEEDGGPPEYIEPLGAALAQRGQKKITNNPLMGYENPVFSTTDL